MAWYQRSYFFNLLNKFNLKNFIFNFIFIFLICVLIDYNIIVDCSNFLNSSQQNIFKMRLLFFYGINFRCSGNVSENISKEALNLFIETINNKNFNFSFDICKFYLEQNGFLKSFNTKSNYAHPNIYLGTFNGLKACFSLTTDNIEHFIKISKKDLINRNVAQYISENVYFYSEKLSQIYTNKNSLHLNKSFYNFNKELIDKESVNSLLQQNYLDLKNIDISKHVLKAMHINKN